MRNWLRNNNILWQLFVFFSLLTFHRRPSPHHSFYQHCCLLIKRDTSEGAFFGVVRKIKTKSSSTLHTALSLFRFFCFCFSFCSCSLLHSLMAFYSENGLRKFHRQKRRMTMPINVNKEEEFWGSKKILLNHFYFRQMIRKKIP